MTPTEHTIATLDLKTTTVELNTTFGGETQLLITTWDYTLEPGPAFPPPPGTRLRVTIEQL